MIIKIIKLALLLVLVIGVLVMSMPIVEAQELDDRLSECSDDDLAEYQACLDDNTSTDDIMALVDTDPEELSEVEIDAVYAADLDQFDSEQMAKINGWMMYEKLGFPEPEHFDGGEVEVVESVDYVAIVQGYVADTWDSVRSDVDDSEGADEGTEEEPEPEPEPTPEPEPEPSESEESDSDSEQEYELVMSDSLRMIDSEWDGKTFTARFEADRSTSVTIVDAGRTARNGENVDLQPQTEQIAREGVITVSYTVVEDRQVTIAGDGGIWLNGYDDGIQAVPQGNYTMHAIVLASVIAFIGILANVMWISRVVKNRIKQVV